MVQAALYNDRPLIGIERKLAIEGYKKEGKPVRQKLTKHAATLLIDAFVHPVTHFFTGLEVGNILTF